MYTVGKKVIKKCMMCSKLLVAHVPQPNNLVYFPQRGNVNTSFVAWCVLVCQLFCTALTVLSIIVVALGLHI
jgi:hypothetical protein